LDLKNVGLALEKLGTLRNKADYETEKPGSFATNSHVRQAILLATSALDGLDRVDGNPARRAAALTALHKAFPWWDDAACLVIFPTHAILEIS
jgi:hypothetical protein